MLMSALECAGDHVDIEDCIGPENLGPLDRLRSENKLLPRALRRKVPPPLPSDQANQAKDVSVSGPPVADSFIPGTQSIYIKTWGCSHNNSDGEYMAGLLASNGYTITDSPLSADLWLLNSCTVKGPSEDSLNNSIRKGQELGKPLVISGCVPQGQRKQAYIKGLSVVGVQQIERVVEVVEQTLQGRTVQLYNLRKEKGKKLGGAPLDLPKIRKNPLVEIIAVSTGCLNQCTYCKTKHARGELGSYQVQDIVARAQQAFSEGVVEVWLTSEDLGAYGHDIGVTLPELLWKLVNVVPNGCMLRLGMTNPPYIMEHMEAMASILSHPRVYSFLHIPVQSGSDRVLSDMRREYTSADFRHLVDYLKEKVPGLNVATDIICGFPTETEEDFSDTLKLVEKYKFGSLFINQFYPRPGTPAARMRRVPTHQVKARSRALSQLFQSYQPYGHKLGQRQVVLVTELSHDQQHYVGHNKYYEQVLVPKEPALLGKMLEVVITSTGKHFLKGEVVEKSLVQVWPRPQPLPPGDVSGVEVWKASRVCSEEVGSDGGSEEVVRQSRKEGTSVLWGVDMWILTVAASVVALALLFRILL